MNLHGIVLLGFEKGFLIKKRFQFFVEKGSLSAFNSFCKQIFETKTIQMCKLRLVKNDNSPFNVYAKGMVVGAGKET